jgi:hypothetical protein
MAAFLSGLIVGIIIGIIFFAFALLEKVKTHDYTILAGRPKWILRVDRINMTYDELKKKYIQQESKP